MFPFEVVVEGAPRSSQTKSAKHRREWVDLVHQTALLRRQEIYELGFLDDRPVAVTIFYFSAEPVLGDIDNLVKPILDALIAVAFPDDQVVERVTIQKFEPEMEREFVPRSVQLASALDADPPIEYIQVTDDLSWRRSP